MISDINLYSVVQRVSILNKPDDDIGSMYNDYAEAKSVILCHSISAVRLLTYFLLLF